MSNENATAVCRYALNSHGRDFVVGDVHGCFSLLDAELAGRGFDLERDRLFSVGDLIDRGPESPSVLDAVRRHRVQAVRGNHEQGILDWRSHTERAHDSERMEAMCTNPDQAIAEWVFHDGSTSELVHNGGQWFLELYRSRRNEERERTQHILSYLSGLPYALEIETAYGRVGIVHAEPVREEWDDLTWSLASGSIATYEREQMLWDRRRWKGRELSTYVDGVTAVIVGHTPTGNVAQRGNVINIDTGASYTNGRITLLDLADVPAWLSRGDLPLTRLLG
ncbi:metallophosphoesterase [Paraburkholderia dinghuensis]|uniref:Serine/threonine protein phosphatase n=1 Tax=Paraburkholderia dinghuensis TaxID=2305225 RepID=A0A3N6PHP2_9BURK|nr:metallophosphoesterase [Paraburkholderia dinghuensis]RQH00200.1 serine/threonine protein phosphatase [Paraburkholderia dinghuensis]